MWESNRREGIQEDKVGWRHACALCKNKSEGPSNARRSTEDSDELMSENTNKIRLKHNQLNYRLTTFPVPSVVNSLAQLSA